MVNFLSLTATLSQISWVQKPGPRPLALAWLWLSHTPGQAKAHLRPKVRPGLAWPSLAWWKPVRETLEESENSHQTSRNDVYICVREVTTIQKRRRSEKRE